ncbi:MAG: hypothetical protein KGY70_19225 [Bacteroidales bacterium]|nr:hypothetical protein [Bacteroidales bacterium]
MEIEVNIKLELDCDDGNQDDVKKAVEEWIMLNLPTVWEDEDAIIDKIKCG